MNLSSFGVLICLIGFTEQTIAQQDICPPWFIPDNTSCTGCSCYHQDAKVYCGPDFPNLHFGFCMTYSNTTGFTAYGACPYIAHYSNLADYSFYNQLPITVMYFLVVIFHIRAISSPLSALVFMSQIVVYTIRLNVPFHMYIENEVTGFSYVALQLLLVLCGIWSLDFFRSVIPPFCVSSNIKTIHALALEYLVAFYPIFLILITYVCIKLHDDNFRPVIWLWKPFRRHFAHLRRSWDSTASIINAFTTFLLLAFSKILFVSFTLLYTIPIRHNYIDIPNKCVLYYDSTVECHTHEYTTFSALAGCVLVIFIICPTILLILYPTRLFRKCVSCCGFRRWHALHMFVESFQGMYKDGNNGIRDFRMVSASFLILRISTLLLFLNHHRLLSHTSILQGAFFYVPFVSMLSQDHTS